jgi:hypothetical protein
LYTIYQSNAALAEKYSGGNGNGNNVNNGNNGNGNGNGGGDGGTGGASINHASTDEILFGLKPLHS